MVNKKIFYVIKFALILFITFNISAQDYYVSVNTGSDNNNGISINTPFKTINKAINFVQPGGTVYVMEGEYRDETAGTPIVSFYEDTTPNQFDSTGKSYVFSNSQYVNNPHVVTINKAGNSTDGYITIKNYSDHTPKIIFDGQGGIKLGPNANYIIIEGFEVQGPSQSITYNQAILNRRNRITLKESQAVNNNNHSYFSGKGIWGGYDDHHHIIIRNNVVHDTPGSGIRFNDSDYITIENNTVYNTTWWTSSASSAIVFAETIAVNDDDNTTEIKMIMRGNIVYNNWNRIPFYAATFPDNAQPPSGNYGNAGYSTILDGQGLYVTRSHSPSDQNPRPGYLGTFLIENNLCVNNGKNGINFDRSNYSSALIRNNTIYFNGVHDIIQDQSVADGNPRHGGQKVAGIISNFVKNITVVNNIVVTRYQDYSALKLNNIDDPFTVDDPQTDDVVENLNDGVKIATNNIFFNGTVAYPGNQTPANIINVSPEFVSAPTLEDDANTIAGWSGYLDGTDFSLLANSPAIDAGNPSYSPQKDINGVYRPTTNENIISSTSFEDSTSGWSAFGSSIQISNNVSKTGDNSLLVNNRTQNWHSPKIDLNNLLEVGETYTVYVWVKLPDGESGNSQLTIKDTSENSYFSLNEPTNVNGQGWTLLSGDYTHNNSNDLFLYVKGPPIQDGVGVDYYIDDFSFVKAGSPEVDFSISEDIVDIGAYEFQHNTDTAAVKELKKDIIIIYPNPSSQIINVTASDKIIEISIYSLAGQLLIKKRDSKDINISLLNSGIYFAEIKTIRSTQVKKIIKN